MSRPVLAVAAAASMMLAGLVATARATATHAYNKNEYLVIVDGAAPNKHLSIASHGGGELGDSGFHLYLMAEPAHAKLAKLARIGPDDVLDTAPDAFHAQWSADSRHVAILFRSERHILALRLYEV
jgi:hypothetical protein